MNRRSNETQGFVSFPVNDPAYRNSGEGGMFVRLIVEATYDSSPMVCSGGYNHVIYDESYIGDDHGDRPDLTLPDDLDSLTSEEIKAIYDQSEKAREAYDAQHFPALSKRRGDTGIEPYISKGYLAAVTLGSTGWSGWHEANGRYWKCTKADLTGEGKQLYALFERLYPGCTLTLQTWLDT